jgi:PAS domain S-box-containing protein
MKRDLAFANGSVFQSLFESSADAIWLYDPNSGLLTDCNQAAVELMGAEDKQQLVPSRPEDLSPAIQPDGSSSAAKTAEIIVVQKQKTHRFEWVVRRRDGREVPVEVSSTAVLMDGKAIHVIISRDISERKTAELKLLEYRAQTRGKCVARIGSQAGERDNSYCNSAALLNEL